MNFEFFFERCLNKMQKNGSIRIIRSKIDPLK